MEWGIPVAVAVILGISGIVYYFVKHAKHSTQAKHSTPAEHSTPTKQSTPPTRTQTKAAIRRLESRTRSILKEQPDLTSKEALLHAIADTSSSNAKWILSTKKSKGTSYSTLARTMLEARTKTR